MVLSKGNAAALACGVAGAAAGLACLLTQCSCGGGRGGVVVVGDDDTACAIPPLSPTQRAKRRLADRFTSLVQLQKEAAEVEAEVAGGVPPGVREARRLEVLGLLERVLRELTKIDGTAIGGEGDSEADLAEARAVRRSLVAELKAVEASLLELKKAHWADEVEEY